MENSLPNWTNSGDLGWRYASFLILTFEMDKWSKAFEHFTSPGYGSDVDTRINHVPSSVREAGQMGLGTRQLFFWDMI